MDENRVFDQKLVDDITAAAEVLREAIDRALAAGLTVKFSLEVGKSVVRERSVIRHGVLATREYKGVGKQRPGSLHA